MNTRMLMLFALMAAALLLSGCGAQRDAESKAEASSAGEGTASSGGMREAYWLGFSSTRDGNYEVYYVDFDSTPPVRLTHDDATEFAYAADDVIYAVSSRADDLPMGDYYLYRINPYDSTMEQITQFPVYDSWLGVSPSRDSLVVCSRKDGKRELFLIDRDGNELAKLTGGDWQDSDPDWSPDGKTLVLRSDRTGAWEIWRMNLDGSDARQLTNDPDNDMYHGYGGEIPPRWSPNGRQIMWASFHDDQWDIYLMDADGGNVRNITNTPDIDETWPSWSPNGQWVAFDAEVEPNSDNYEIYVMRTDGSGRRRMTFNEELDLAPVWIKR